MKKVKVVDDYHGMKVYDPYRWLEDIHSEDTTMFVDEHNEKTKEFVESYYDYDIIKDRMKELWRFDSYSSPKKFNGYYYFFIMMEAVISHVTIGLRNLTEKKSF